MAIRLQFEFTDPESVLYKVEISDNEYTGSIRQIQGSASLEYPKVSTMDMLRGSVLKMRLEATTDTNYYNFLIERVGDAQLPVTLYRDGQIFWKGFIKPDGLVESFVNDRWFINVQAIDGLGYLKNIKFLKANGEVYQDSVKEIILLARCLQITGQIFEFTLYDFDLFFTVQDDLAPTLSQKAIINTFSNTNRFFKEDNSNSVFTAQDVLESILKKYGAYVTQQNGEWHIVRIESYFRTGETIGIERFNLDGLSLGTGTRNRQIVLGSQINGFYPHHSNANQQKNYNVALTAYKVYYEYGLVQSIIANRKVRYNNNLGSINEWEIITDDWNGQPISSFFIFEFRNDDNEFYPNGYWVGKMTSVFDETWRALKTRPSIPTIVKANNGISVEIKSTTTWIKEIYQLVNIILIGESNIRYYLRADPNSDVAIWGTDVAALTIFDFYTPSAQLKTRSSIFTVDSDVCPENGEIEVEFYLPIVNPLGGQAEYTIIDEVNIVESTPSDVKGESWTGIRGDNRPETRTAIVDSLQVYTGDNSNQAYIGGIEDITGENTIRWSKKLPNGSVDISKQFPVLDWLTRDRLKISSGNSLLFTGGIYGYLPYLGVLTIDNIGSGNQEPQIPNIFMVVGWAYDLRMNIMSAQFERIFQEDIYADTVVNFKIEGDNVIRPAIEGV